MEPMAERTTGIPPGSTGTDQGDGGSGPATPPDSLKPSNLRIKRARSPTPDDKEVLSAMKRISAVLAQRYSSGASTAPAARLKGVLSTPRPDESLLSAARKSQVFADFGPALSTASPPNVSTDIGGVSGVSVASGALSRIRRQEALYPGGSPVATLAGARQHVTPRASSDASASSAAAASAPGHGHGRIHVSREDESAAAAATAAAAEGVGAAVEATAALWEGLADREHLLHMITCRRPPSLRAAARSWASGAAAQPRVQCQLVNLHGGTTQTLLVLQAVLHGALVIFFLAMLGQSRSGAAFAAAQLGWARSCAYALIQAGFGLCAVWLWWVEANLLSFSGRWQPSTAPRGDNRTRPEAFFPPGHARAQASEAGVPDDSSVSVARAGMLHNAMPPPAAAEHIYPQAPDPEYVGSVAAGPLSREATAFKPWDLDPYWSRDMAGRNAVCGWHSLVLAAFCCCTEALVCASVLEACGGNVWPWSVTAYSGLGEAPVCSSTLGKPLITGVLVLATVLQSFQCCCVFTTDLRHAVAGATFILASGLGTLVVLLRSDASIPTSVAIGGCLLGVVWLLEVASALEMSVAVLLGVIHSEECHLLHERQLCVEAAAASSGSASSSSSPAGPEPLHEGHLAALEGILEEEAGVMIERFLVQFASRIREGIHGISALTEEIISRKKARLEAAVASAGRKRRISRTLAEAPGAAVPPDRGVNSGSPGVASRPQPPQPASGAAPSTIQMNLAPPTVTVTATAGESSWEGPRQIGPSSDTAAPTPLAGAAVGVPPQQAIVLGEVQGFSSSVTGSATGQDALAAPSASRSLSDPLPLPAIEHGTRGNLKLRPLLSGAQREDSGDFAAPETPTLSREEDDSDLADLLAAARKISDLLEAFDSEQLRGKLHARLMPTIERMLGHHHEGHRLSAGSTDAGLAGGTTPQSDSNMTSASGSPSSIPVGERFTSFGSSSQLTPGHHRLLSSTHRGGPGRTTPARGDVPRVAQTHAGSLVSTSPEGDSPSSSQTWSDAVSRPEAMGSVSAGTNGNTLIVRRHLAAVNEDNEEQPSSSGHGTPAEGSSGAEATTPNLLASYRQPQRNTGASTAYSSSQSRTELCDSRGQVTSSYRTSDLEPGTPLVGSDRDASMESAGGPSQASSWLVRRAALGLMNTPLPSGTTSRVLHRSLSAANTPFGVAAEEPNMSCREPTTGAVSSLLPASEKQLLLATLTPAHLPLASNALERPVNASLAAQRLWPPVDQETAQRAVSAGDRRQGWLGQARGLTSVAPGPSPVRGSEQPLDSVWMPAALSGSGADTAGPATGPTIQQPTSDLQGGARSMAATPLPPGGELQSSGMGCEARRGMQLPPRRRRLSGSTQRSRRQQQQQQQAAEKEWQASLEPLGRSDTLRTHPSASSPTSSGYAAGVEGGGHDSIASVVHSGSSGTLSSMSGSRSSRSAASNLKPRAALPPYPRMAASSHLMPVPLPHHADRLGSDEGSLGGEREGRPLYHPVGPQRAAYRSTSGSGGSLSPSSLTAGTCSTGGILQAHRHRSRRARRVWRRYFTATDNASWDTDAEWYQAEGTAASHPHPHQEVVSATPPAVGDEVRSQGGADAALRQQLLLPASRHHPAAPLTEPYLPFELGEASSTRPLANTDTASVVTSSAPSPWKDLHIEVDRAPLLDAARRSLPTLFSETSGTSAAQEFQHLATARGDETVSGVGAGGAGGSSQHRSGRAAIGAGAGVSYQPSSSRWAAPALSTAVAAVSPPPHPSSVASTANAGPLSAAPPSSGTIASFTRDHDAGLPAPTTEDSRRDLDFEYELGFEHAYGGSRSRRAEQKRGMDERPNPASAEVSDDAASLPVGVDVGGFAPVLQRAQLPAGAAGTITSSSPALRGFAVGQADVGGAMDTLHSQSHSAAASSTTGVVAISPTIIHGELTDASAVLLGAAPSSVAKGGGKPRTVAASYDLPMAPVGGGLPVMVAPVLAGEEASPVAATAGTRAGPATFVVPLVESADTGLSAQRGAPFPVGPAFATTPALPYPPPAQQDSARLRSPTHRTHVDVPDMTTGLVSHLSALSSDSHTSSSSTSSAAAEEHGTASILPLSKLKFGLHVLVVDDEVVNRRIAGRMLERLGCTYDGLEDGNQVVTALVTSVQPYDVILLDILLKQSNGIDVCRNLREQHVEIPIIAATANYAPKEHHLYRSAGFTRVLTKPFTQADLAIALTQVLGIQIGRGANLGFR